MIVGVANVAWEESASKAELVMERTYALMGNGYHTVGMGNAIVEKITLLAHKIAAMKMGLLGTTMFAM